MEARATLEQVEELRRVLEALARRYGELVRRLRTQKGYSQEEFSFRVGLHQTYVSSVERGERNVTIGTADRIAKALGTTLSSMFSELEHSSGASERG